MQPAATGRWRLWAVFLLFSLTAAATFEQASALQRFGVLRRRYRAKRGRRLEATPASSPSVGHARTMKQWCLQQKQDDNLLSNVCEVIMNGTDSSDRARTWPNEALDLKRNGSFLRSQNRLTQEKTKHKPAVEKIGVEKLRHLKAALNQLMHLDSNELGSVDGETSAEKVQGSKLLNEMNFNDPAAYFMGDIDLTESQYKDWLKLAKEMSGEGGSHGYDHHQRWRRAIPGMFKNKAWHSPAIHYEMDESIPAKLQQTVERTLRIWERHTCLRFVEDRHMDDGLRFVSDKGCSSFVGHAGGVQTVDVLFPYCDHVGVVSHLLGHALGLWHEHNRRDSAAFLHVHLENVSPDSYHAFLSFDDGTLDTDQLPYEYASVMHFDMRTAPIAIDPNRPTLTPIDPAFLNVMGQRQSPTYLDYEKVNAMYCAADECNDHLRCLHNGYQNFANCSECICPPGFSGRLCNHVEQRDGSAFGSCGGELHATAAPQYLATPLYPDPFPRKQYCVWYLKAPDRLHRVFVKFVETFDLPCQRHCRWSYVEIKAGPPFNRVGPRFCCKQSPTPTEAYSSSDDEMVIIFKSDSDTAGGFRLRYWSKPVREQMDGSAAEPESDESYTPTTSSPASTETDDVTGTTSIIIPEMTTSLTDGEPIDDPYCMCSQWSEWQECTQKCGGCGRRLRHRQCRRACETVDAKRCNFDRCTGSKFIINNGEFFLLLNGCCFGLAPGSEDKCRKTSALDSLMGGLLSRNNFSFF